MSTRWGASAAAVLLLLSASPAMSGGSPLRAQSGIISAPAAVGRTAALSAQGRDSSPNSDARLVSEYDGIVPGEPFTIGIHVTLDEGWHTYWRNAGDAGTGMLTDWDLPAGFSVDSLSYPVPERIPYPPLLNYGYNDEVVLLARVTPPDDLIQGSRVRLAVGAEWLVCEDICIPARDDLELELSVRDTDGSGARSPEAELIEAWRERLPVRSEAWALRAARTDSGYVLAARPPEGWPGSMAGAYFFSADPGALEHTPEQPAGTADGEARLRLPASPYLADEPERLEGVLKLPEGSSVDAAGHRGLLVSVPLERGEAAVWTAEATVPLRAPAVAGGGQAAGLSLAAALVFALIGGLILNLMPCVFPILSLKALGFANRGGDRAGMRRDGIAFGLGVVLSFLAVAGILMAVRASGAEIGWGYQLQSPPIVAILAALMFGIGLMLAGVIELGASLTRLGGIGSGDGPGSSFLTGVLATVVATPCTAPFMGAAIGTALIRPPAEGLAVFAGLGVGMAAPYVLLAFWPALARRLPKPGRWMETFKQVLAFPMFAVAIWLLWVFGLQVGMGGAARLLFALLLLAMGAWFLGRWPAAAVSRRARTLTRAAATAALVLAVLAGVAATRGGPSPTAGDGAAATSLDWQPFSREAVEALRAEGRPVFVDFTAAWCISCQVNERVALETAAVRAAFAERDVALLKADWTRRDPAITQALASFGRSGVPLYVLYPADPAAEPRILPELLTQKMVLEALSEIPVTADARLDSRVSSLREDP